MIKKKVILICVKKVIKNKVYMVDLKYNLNLLN